MNDEDELDDEPLDGDVSKGIVAGLPVLVIEDEDDGIWIAPANRFSRIVLTPYMSSWFYNDDSPVFVYDGNYWAGLFDWLFTAKDEDG